MISATPPRAGAVRRTYRQHNKPSVMLTLLGEVRFKRMGHGDQSAESIFPLDGAVSLATDEYSHGLRERVAPEVAKRVFNGAVSSVEGTDCGKVPSARTRRLRWM